MDAIKRLVAPADQREAERLRKNRETVYYPRKMWGIKLRAGHIIILALLYCILVFWGIGQLLKSLS